MTFWIAVTLLVYPYVVYPAVLALLVKAAPRAARSCEPGGPRPTVTVIVSAHDEESVIEEKIRTTLAADYPADRLAVLVVSDASTDGTNARVGAMAEANEAVRLLAIEEHRGKTAGLNAAMSEIDSDIVIFTDANAIFDSRAISTLVDCFADPSVGYAVGAALYHRSETSSAGEDEGLYWRYELALKKMESAFESVVGGDGAIYAVRRELYEPLEPEDINDFVNPLQVVAGGHRGVFCEDAIAYEDPANDYAKEFRRKRRIVCRSWGGLLRYARRLRLSSNPRFLFMLVSHKVVRWFTFAWLLIGLLANLALVATGHGGIYLLSLAGYLVFSGLAVAGWSSARRRATLSRWVSLPFYFCMSNLAALLGVLDYARGNRYVTWQHARQ